MAELRLQDKLLLFLTSNKLQVAEKNFILTKEAASRKMQRIALEIASELYAEKDELVVIGIAVNGMAIANKLISLLDGLLPMPLSIISCSLNKKHPDEVIYERKIDFNGKNVLLVDDVTSSGRTLLYALKPLLQFYPKRIQTMCLVERMHKNFPIKIDYIGLSIATTLQDHIQVEVDDDEVQGAYLL